VIGAPYSDWWILEIDGIAVVIGKKNEIIAKIFIPIFLIVFGVYGVCVCISVYVMNQRNATMGLKRVIS